MSVFKTWDLWRQAYAAAGYVDDEEQDMTTLREAAAQALEALGLWATGRDMDAVALNDLIAGLEAALADGDNLSPIGCDHCRHVLYAATKCKNCGRMTE